MAIGVIQFQHNAACKKGVSSCGPIKAALCAWLVLSQLLHSAPPNPDPALIGYWGFDETGSREYFDYSGHNSSATIHGEVNSVEGIVGRALEFSGPINFAEVLDGKWNAGAPMSIVFWFKPKPLEKGERAGAMIEHQATGAVPGMFTCTADGHVGVCDSQARVVDCGLAKVRPGEWNFMGITISTNEVCVYADGQPAGRAKLNGFPVTPGRLSIGARASIGDSYYRGAIDEVLIYHRILSPSEMAAIHLKTKSGIAPLAISTVEVLGLSTDKLLYGSKEIGTAKVVVKNFGPERKGAMLRLKLISLLQKESTLYEKMLDLAPSEIRTIEVPVNFGGHSMGCQLLAQAGSGPEISRMSEYLSVSDNLWEVGVCGPFTPSQDCQKTPLQLERELEDIRAGYGNWLEVFFWAPDDWGCLAPKKDHWWSGQTGYLIRQTSLKNLILQAHQHGIKVITYGKNVGCGPDGWELARRHPDWFLHNPDGRVAGYGEPFTLDNWNNEELRRSGKFHTGWDPIAPDLRNLEALDWGISQIVLSTREFGWDGVRFDDHFTAGNDEWTTFNTQRMKERIWRDYPNFLFGYNFGISPDNAHPLDHEKREAMSGGGMWLQEAIRDWTYGPGLRYTNWTEYGRNELRAAKQVQAEGGSYHAIYSLGFNPAQDEYKLIYGLIAGGHSVYGSHTRAPGCANWGQFMTRWSSFLWDRRLRFVKSPEDRITVTGSSTNLAWKPFVQELTESAHRKFLIVHLVNTPAENIEKTTNYPAGISLVNVRFQGRETPKRVVLIRPETDPYDRELSLPRPDNDCSVSIPNLQRWAIVVCELEGNFPTEAIPPRFTAPPKIDRAPAKQPIARGEQVFATDVSSQNVNAPVVSDADSAGGLAQRKDWRAAVYMGRSWVGPFTPGRFRVSYRVKWVEDRAGVQVASIVVSEQKTGRRLVYRDITSLDAKVNSPATNRYQYHPVEITLTNAGFIQCHLVTSRDFKPTPNLVFLDQIRVERLQSFTDNQVFPELIGGSDTGTGLTPNGDHPKSVLLVKGLYWQQYGLESLIECKSSYSYPTNSNELYSNDAVILCNMDLTFMDPSLRALYRQYVLDGGRIIFLGGPNALNLGGLEGTFLQDLLPVRLEGSEPKLVQAAAALGWKKSEPFLDRPLVLWHHDLKPRSESQVIAFVGEVPIATRRRTGHGQVIVFAGTVLGEPGKNEHPFWECPSWGPLLRRMVLEP